MGESSSDPAALENVVQAALTVARVRGVPVGDVPLVAVAAEAGISRSTLLRRLGGTRRALDDAVRAAGVDPQGQKSVRERAVEAAAVIVSERGLSSVTLERVAGGAGCSVHSLYAVFGGRDDLLRAVYERYTPFLDVQAVLAGPHEDLPDTVRRIHRALFDALDREPRVLPAMLADALSRPRDPVVVSVYERFFPRMLSGIGGWLADEIAAGRIRDLHPLVLMQQLTGPVLSHFLFRPAAPHVVGGDLPANDEVIEDFTQAFLRAVVLPRPS